MRKLILGICLVVPLAAQAGQPISESFVQCAQLVDSSNRWFPERRGSEKGEKLRIASERLMAEAEAEARREGISDVPAYLAALSAEKAAFWDARGLPLLASEEFRDWMQYCNKLAASRGVRLKD